MVGTNVKAETNSLMDKRSALESEMNSIIARLSQPGAPGLSGNLVDSEVLFSFLLDYASVTYPSLLCIISYFSIPCLFFSF
jgi:hypothetical protein